MKYLKLEEINPNGSKTPVIFVHGFPDSSEMYSQYLDLEWLSDRPIFLISFPNRHNNKIIPKFMDLVRGAIYKEFDDLIIELINKSKTGKIAMVSHDWGATYTWRFIRNYNEVANKNIEFYIALSVGSSFRYDVFEHGLSAMLWLYSSIFCLPYYISGTSNTVSKIIKKYAGYQSDTVINKYDCWHYWYGPFQPIRLLFDLLGFAYQKEFIDFHFPTLYIRSHDDRIASTKKYEKYIREQENCEMHLIESDNHWFPEQKFETVKNMIEPFIQSKVLNKNHQ